LIIMQKTNFNGKLDDARSKLFEVSSTLLSVSMKLQTIKDASELIDQTKKEVKEMNSKNKKLVVDKESLELILLAFGQKGIRSMVIDYVVPQLEEKINNILAKLSDFRVIIDTQKSGLSKDTVLEGLFIDVVNERGEIFNFDNYSGGEKLKIVIAISEALSEIQNIGFRILDEVFFALDDESLEKFAEVMLALQERFPQLICISHLKNIKDLFDDQIEIVKINGDSIIK